MQDGVKSSLVEIMFPVSVSLLQYIIALLLPNHVHWSSIHLGEGKRRFRVFTQLTSSCRYRRQLHTERLHMVTAVVTSFVNTISADHGNEVAVESRRHC